MSVKKPEIIVFAGPNGSGKSTIKNMTKVILKPYINADDIKISAGLSDLEAAIEAEKLREDCLKKGSSFTFETVLSTDRNLKLLERAKAQGYFIRCYYVLTVDPEVNVLRVQTRVASGGHPVEKETIIKRYGKALELIPRLLKCCDVCHLYDNTLEPYRIYKKRKEQCFIWTSMLWTEEQIMKLTGQE